MIIRGGRVGIGTTTVVSNVLQVGAGGRLRIANNNTDYTIIGTNDTDGATNTQIVISGSERATNAGNIQYVATSTGKHIFNTGGTTERMTIVSTGNIGIGTSEPTNKLHIRDDTTTTTALTIQNNNTTTTTTLPTEIVVAETTATIIGNARCIQFTYYSNSTYYTSKDYTFTTTEPLICDILIVGGGGGGGAGHGGGGGAGQLILIHQATLNGTYTIKVGNGGNGAILTSGGSLTSGATKGSNSEFGNTSINVIAEGGGTNGGTNIENKNGGSGAGGDNYTGGGGTSGINSPGSSGAAGRVQFIYW
jgi:hypothetical protein